ncbi:MAG TPA: multicopper oxidase domain-containing protein [Candidatus Elarobacter sp.]|nr:multicopper oxidase domain-containing protein [Candidatus Elarobacter sp.]
MKRKIRHVKLYVLPCLVVLAFSQASVLAQTTTGSSPTPVAPVPNPCPRLTAGTAVHQPPALFSSSGVLNVRFSYQQTTDSVGRLLHCFMTDTGLEEPTLHVNPGDTLNITVTNNTPMQPFGETYTAPNCGDATVQFTPPANGIASVGASVNIHYHGTNVTPQCGGDNVTRTLINPGPEHTFQYSFTFPTDEPPGLYWYHPHVHGLAERDLLGGATGALVVDGIQNVQPAVRGMRQRILVIRDQPQVQGAAEGPGNCGVDVPFQDISVNYVPIDSHATFNSKGKLSGITFTPAVFSMMTGETQFWRVTNSTADTILDLQVLYDGVPQTLQIAGIDAVPVNSQDGTQPGMLIPATRYRLPVAGRVEFLVQAPASTVKVAQLVTNNINNGPQGDCDPTRPIFNIALSNTDTFASAPDDYVGAYTGLTISDQRFGGLSSQPVSATRTFQFSEIQPTQFFITQVSAGQQPTLFDNNNPPAVVTTQGSVEKWIVQNIAGENHEFHQHQVHFLVQSQDNFEANGSTQAPAITGQFADMIEVPFWSGKKNVPFPQVQLLMDFRGMDIGDFVYHCHILSHEDLGMMAIIRVLPKP